MQIKTISIENATTKQVSDDTRNETTNKITIVNNTRINTTLIT